jgi:tellurite resistance protein TerC
VEFAFLFADWLGKPAWVWLGFLGVVIALLALDLGVLSRGAKEIPVSRSLWMSAFYTAVACAFGVWVWWRMGAESGMAYFTGFAVEKTLALDNVFVISLIFAYFAIPRAHQHRVLFWASSA